MRGLEGKGDYSEKNKKQSENKVLPWSGEAVVPNFVSDIELMARGLLVVVGFTTFCALL